MSQCKVPLDQNKPDINICIDEEGHEGEHYTYGLGWAHIRYSQKISPRRYGNEVGVVVNQELLERLSR